MCKADNQKRSCITYLWHPVVCFFFKLVAYCSLGSLTAKMLPLHNCIVTLKQYGKPDQNLCAVRGSSGVWTCLSSAVGKHNLLALEKETTSWTKCVLFESTQFNLEYLNMYFIKLLLKDQAQV